MAHFLKEARTCPMHINGRLSSAQAKQIQARSSPTIKKHIGINRTLIFFKIVKNHSGVFFS